MRYFVILLCFVSLYLASLYSEPYILSIGEPVLDIFYFDVPDHDLQILQLEKGGANKIDYPTFLHIQNHLSKLKSKIMPGGSAASTTKGLAKLGHKCCFIGKSGVDIAASYFWNDFNLYKVTYRNIPSPSPTSQNLCLISPNGQRTMRCCIGASSELTPQEITPEYFHNITHLHMEGYMLYNLPVVEKMVALAKQVHATISLDLASFEVVRKFKATILHMLENDLDLVFANKDEAFALTQKEPYTACLEMQNLCPIVVILADKQGCYVGKEGTIFNAPPPEVKVVDTTGAGDLFISGFLHGYLTQHPLTACAQMGNLLGSTCITEEGAGISESNWVKIYDQLPLLN